MKGRGRKGCECVMQVEWAAGCESLAAMAISRQQTEASERSELKGNLPTAHCCHAEPSRTISKGKKCKLRKHKRFARLAG